MSSELCKGQNQQKESPNHSLSERLPALGIKFSPFHSFPTFFIYLPTFPLVSIFLILIFKNAKLLIHFTSLAEVKESVSDAWSPGTKQETLSQSMSLSSLSANICFTHHPLMLPLLLFRCSVCSLYCFCLFFWIIEPCIGTILASWFIS